MPWCIWVWLAGPHGKGRGRLLMGVVGGRRVMKRMVKGRMPMKESSGKLGGGSCRIVTDFFFFFLLRSNQKNNRERHFLVERKDKKNVRMRGEKEKEKNIVKVRDEKEKEGGKNCPKK